jgi:hypothetical protein
MINRLLIFAVWFYSLMIKRVMRFLPAVEMTLFECHQWVEKWRRSRHFSTPPPTAIRRHFERSEKSL